MNNRDINKIKTTITVKLGTKNKLLDIAKKGESFDDVINRLVKTNEINEKIISEYKNILKDNSLEFKNTYTLDKIDRGINSIYYNDILIKYSYNKPQNILDVNYGFEIIIEKIFSNNEQDIDVEHILAEKDHKIMIYFKIIEKIINIHFDSAYSLPGNKNLLDTHYWRKVWNRIHLNDHSFDHDIGKFIAGIMENAYE